MTTAPNSSNMAQRLTQYHLAQRNLFKTMIKSGTMPLTQYHILDMLSKNKNMRMGEISQLMSISRPNLTPLVDKLVSVQFVERINDTHDRRVTYITITESGLKELEKEREAINQNVLDFAAQLAPEEYEEFSNAIDCIINIANKH